MKTVSSECIESFNRIQMAEAVARMHGADRVEAVIARSKPGS